MSGPIIRSGPSPKFVQNWDSVFGKGDAKAKKADAKSGAKAEKKSAKAAKPAAAKPAKKSAKKKAKK